MAILVFIESRGAEESNKFNIVMTLGKLITLGVMISVACFNFEGANMKPFFSEEYGMEGTIFAASLLFYGYLGFDLITTIAEDSRNPIKDVPRAVRDSTIICAVLYTLTSVSLIGIGLGTAPDYVPETAMADVYGNIGFPSMTIVIYFCAFFGTTAACFTNFLAQSRLIVAQAKQGLLPPSFYRVNSRGNPAFATVVASLVCMVPAFLFDLETISEFVSLGNLVSYSYVTICGTSLRYQSNRTGLSIFAAFLIAAISSAFLLHLKLMTAAAIGYALALLLLLLLWF